MILTCLLDYERLCKHRVEKLPFNNDDDDEEQDAVLNHRISFHDLRSNAWSILSSMIDMHNVHILLPLHIPLQLSADQFYKQAIESALSTNDESNEEASSHKSTKHQIDFDRLSNLVKKIQDQSQAIDMLKYIISAYNSDHIDVINNRIEALEMACSWCTSWSEHLSVEQKQETLNETLQQFQQQLNECRTHAMLCTNGWLILKPYISDPLILIRELYSMNELWTPLIDQHQHQHRKSCTKESVNMLISMLCKHYKLQSDKVLSAILMEWLKEPISSSITSTTYLLSTWLQMTSHTDEQEEHRRVKLVRLMQTTLYEKRVSYLLKFAYQPSHKIPTVARIRALTVLFMVADAQAITRVHRYEDVREYLHLLLYMVDFEDLRISQSLKEFHACDKLALARSLWISHSHDVKLVKLIGNLCMDFKLYDLVLWEHLLTHLVQAREIDYMTRILEHIDTISELSRLTVIPTIRSRLVHAAIDELATSTLSNHYNELRIMALIHRQSGSLDEQEMIRIVNYAQRTYPS
ncbi:RZZ complex, subunit KNTC1/ROD [Syncephalis plumigaleata]|nr:RZZ complex, subunit KNTC1/ROD [Syncephalis plumigaleata]